MILDFEWPENLNRCCFVVSKSNSDAFSMINKVTRWPGSNLLIHGPKFCGKTHIGNIFIKDSCGQIVDRDTIELPIVTSCVVDSLDTIDERLIMGIFYRTQPFNIPVLWLSRKIPQFSINDLNTRFNSIFSLQITQPDESTFKKIFTKRCTDFGLQINDEMLEYLVRRIEITYESINDTVLKLNAYCLEHMRSPSIHILGKIIHGNEFSEEEYQLKD